MPLSSSKSRSMKTSFKPLNVARPRQRKDIFAPAVECIHIKEEPRETKLSSLLYRNLLTTPPVQSRVIRVEESNFEEENSAPSVLDALSTSPSCRDDESLISNNSQVDTIIDTQQDKEDYINLFCTKCKRKFSRKDTYRQHLQKMHKKVLNLSITIQHPPIRPDKDDLNIYCAPCKKSFQHKRSYRYHLEIVHGITSTRPRPKTALDKSKKYYQLGQPGYKPEAFCSKCNKGFRSRQGYLTHLKRTHHWIPVLTPENTPDEQDPNLCCSVCEKIFTRKASYRFHLRKVHQMELANGKQRRRRSERLPDVNDPNWYCNACKRVYCSKDSFNNHMRRIHQLKYCQKEPDGTSSCITKQRRAPSLLSTILLESNGLKTKN